jgi:hypothetical protein
MPKVLPKTRGGSVHLAVADKNSGRRRCVMPGGPQGPEAQNLLLFQCKIIRPLLVHVIVPAERLREIADLPDPHIFRRAILTSSGLKRTMFVPDPIVLGDMKPS